MPANLKIILSFVKIGYFYLRTGGNFLAGDFYRKCGFTEKGRIVYRKVPLICFELVIVDS